jgi:hypothetical protein
MAVIPHVMVWWVVMSGLLAVVLNIIYFATRGVWHEKNPAIKLIVIFMIWLVLTLLNYFIILPP